MQNIIQFSNLLCTGDFILKLILNKCKLKNIQKIHSFQVLTNKVTTKYEHNLVLILVYYLINKGIVLTCAKMMLVLESAPYL